MLNNQYLRLFRDRFEKKENYNLFLLKMDYANHMLDFRLFFKLNVLRWKGNISGLILGFILLLLSHTKAAIYDIFE